VSIDGTQIDANASKIRSVRGAYNAQAVVRAEGSQLILAADLVASPFDALSFAAPILGMEKTVGLLPVGLADAGFASGPAVA
jgi:hypothetical protein